MPGTTPIYGLPYPEGTDPVREGDNTIKALAERMEALLSGPRDWSYAQAADTTSGMGGDATWRRIAAVTLTGLPVGGRALVISNAIILPPNQAGAFMEMQFSSDTAEFVDGGYCVVQNETALQCRTLLSMATVAVAEAVDPVIYIDWMCNTPGGGGGAPITYCTGSHIRAMRTD